MSHQRVPRHAKHFALGLVGIGDESALDDIGRAGDGSQGGGHEAPRARFGGHDLEFAAATRDEHMLGGRP